MWKWNDVTVCLPPIGKNVYWITEANYTFIENIPDSFTRQQLENFLDPTVMSDGSLSNDRVTGWREIDSEVISP